MPFDHSLCLSCQSTAQLDNWGYCVDCSWIVEAVVGDDTPAMPSLADIAFDLEAARDALRDLGYNQIAGMIKPAIRAIDKQLWSNDDATAPVTPAKPVVQLQRAAARRKEEA